MKPATTFIHDAHYAALTTGAGGTALTAVGVASTDVFDAKATQGSVLPAVVYSQEVETEPLGRRTDAARATETVIVSTCWDVSPRKSKALAALVAEHTVKESFTLTGLTGASTVNARLDFFGATFSDGQAPQAYGTPVGVRYLVYQAD